MYLCHFYEMDNISMNVIYNTQGTWTRVGPGFRDRMLAVKKHRQKQENQLP